MKRELERISTMKPRVPPSNATETTDVRLWANVQPAIDLDPYSFLGRVAFGPRSWRGGDNPVVLHRFGSQRKPNEDRSEDCVVLVLVFKSSWTACIICQDQRGVVLHCKSRLISEISVKRLLCRLRRTVKLEESVRTKSCIEMFNICASE